MKATAASQAEESAKRNEREVRGLLDAAVAGLERQLERVRKVNKLIIS